MLRIWGVHSVLLVLHAFDLLTTSRVTPSHEANPLARVLWARWGFGVLVLLKGLSWAGMLAYHLAIQKWLPRYEVAVAISVSVGLAVMVAVVVWNIQRFGG